MSRISKYHGPLIITRGMDHVLGSFFDVQDTRYAGTPNDTQGEGFVFEWSSIQGILNNLIEVDIDTIKAQPSTSAAYDYIRERCDEFCSKQGIIK